MSLASEISFYMKVAIDINKKVGGTRAYGKSFPMLRG
jgi:hypothetical protein